MLITVATEGHFQKLRHRVKALVEAVLIIMVLRPESNNYQHKKHNALYGRGGARRHWEISLVCLGVGGGMPGDLTAEEQLEPPDELPRHWGNAFS